MRIVSQNKEVSVSSESFNIIRSNNAVYAESCFLDGKTVLLGNYDTEKEAQDEFIRIHDVMESNLRHVYYVS